MPEAAELLRNAGLALVALCLACMVPDLIAWYRDHWKRFLDRL